jgi:ribosome-associated protein
VTEPRRSLDPKDLADRAARFALEKKARDVLVLDLRREASVCDYFVIATGESEPQVEAIAERVEAGLVAAGERPWHVEGRRGKTWVLLDYVDVVVHVFLERTRETYMLERLWGDAPRESVGDGTRDS